MEKKTLSCVFCLSKGMKTQQKTNCRLQFSLDLSASQDFFPAGGVPAKWFDCSMFKTGKTPHCSVLRLTVDSPIYGPPILSVICLPLCIWISGNATLCTAERRPTPTLNTTSELHHPWCLCQCVMTN